MRNKGYLDLMVATFLLIFIFLIFFFFTSIVGFKKTTERISEDLDKKALNYIILRHILLSPLNDSEKEIFKEYKAEKVYHLIYFYFLNKEDDNFSKNFEKVLRYRLDSFSEKYTFFIMADNKPILTLTKGTKIQEFLEGLRENYAKLYLPFQDKKIEVMLIT